MVPQREEATLQSRRGGVWTFSGPDGRRSRTIPAQTYKGTVGAEALFHGTAAGCPMLFAVRRITLIIALARTMAQTMTRIIPMLRLMDVHRQESNSVLEPV